MRLISVLFLMDGILKPMGRWGPGKETQCSINPTGRQGKQQGIDEEDEGEMKGGGRLYFYQKLEKRHCMLCCSCLLGFAMAMPLALPHLCA